MTEPSQAEWSPPPTSRRVLIVGVAVLSLTLLALFQESGRVRTGELLIQAGANPLRVTIRSGNHVVAAETDRRSFQLLPGAYSLEVVEGEAGQALEPSAFTLTRGSKVVARLRELVNPAGPNP